MARLACRTGAVCPGPQAAALIQNLVNKPVLMENAAEMETKPEQELSAKQKALGDQPDEPESQ